MRLLTDHRGYYDQALEYVDDNLWWIAPWDPAGLGQDGLMIGSPCERNFVLRQDKEALWLELVKTHR